MFALLTISALFAGAFAMPAANPTPDVTPTITFCATGNPAPCIKVPIPDNDGCTTFTGGLTVLNGEVVDAAIPDGFFCDFFTKQNCVSINPGDSIFVATNGATTEFFNPSTFPMSSFTCSAF